MKRVELKRTKPLRAKKFWNPPRKELRKRNDERRSRVAKQRAKDRRSQAEMDARSEGWIRANGICECGCGYPFGDYKLDHPEWHHTSYRKHRGVWLRKRCHERIEMTEFSYRHTTRKSAA